MNYKDLSIRNYFIFGEVMRDPVLCRKVLEALLQTPVGELTVPENEKLIKFTKDGKAIRLDIYAEEKDTGRIYDTEMQNLNGHTRESLCLPKRSRFYQALIDARQMEEARDYSELNDTEIVFICTFDPFGRGLARYDVEEKCLQIPDLIYDCGTKKIFFNTTAINGNLPQAIRNIYEYINKGLVNDELTSEMDRAVGRAGTDNKLRDDFMRSEVILMDARREGYLEGCESGEKRAVLKLFRKGDISEEQACRELGITTEELEKLTESE